MTESILLREDRDRIATLTLNSPGNLNALSDTMLAALQGELDLIASDRAIKVVILRAEGRAFCAGHDLREMTAGRQAEDGGMSYFADLFARCSNLMLTITHLPQPVIAEVHALATAAGCQLVATCDLALATESARFGVNGVNIGLFCSTPMVALSRVVARKRAFEMLVTGSFIDADRAAEIGLINRVVAAAALGGETRALAMSIAGKLGVAVRLGKRAFYDQIALDLEEAYTLTGEVMVENMAESDTAEGIAAFLEKRPPGWSAGA